MKVSFLDMPKSELVARGGIHTAREISGQPDLWLNIWQRLQESYVPIKRFIDTFAARENCDIILTGAGTSAFIGEVLAGWLRRETGYRVRAVSTTDIVTHPKHIFFKDKPTFLVSFARSGNSPESVATMDLANQLCDTIAHLVITCNPDGQLIQQLEPGNGISFLLPPEANDKSLAMTGSFTAMSLAGMLLLGGKPLERYEPPFLRFIGYGKDFFARYLPDLHNLADMEFRRAVFLGSGAMHGSAHEAHLKLQELTDGQVICKYDSFLGFRHGPKAVIDRETLNVFLFSNNKYVLQYEYDLVADINRGEKGCFRLGISETKIDDIELDLNIYFTENHDELPEPLLAILHVLPAQVMGFYKSLFLGLKPDTPSLSGTITRVVQGVNIYPFKDE